MLLWSLFSHYLSVSLSHWKVHFLWSSVFHYWRNCKLDLYILMKDPHPQMNNLHWHELTRIWRYHLPPPPAPPLLHLLTKVTLRPVIKQRYVFLQPHSPHLKVGYQRSVWSLAWQCTPEILAPGMWRQDNQEFKGILNYRANSRPAWNSWGPVSIKQTRTNGA